MSNAVDVVLYSLTRDLSVCTPAEMRARWPEGGPERAAADAILEQTGRSSLEELLADHNPIYYLAERVFFNEVADDPSFLYSPVHRDILCKEALDYYLNGKSTGEFGFLYLQERETYKSTFFHGVIPLWIALREKHLHGKDVRILLMHQKEDQASGNAVRLRGKTLGHPWLKKFWPEFCADDSYGTKTAYNWPCVPVESSIAEPSIKACGIGADLTGLHFDHVFFSDLVILDHMYSKTLRDDTLNRHEALQYVTKLGKSLRWYDGTRYHVNDLYGKLIKGGKCRAVILSAIKDDGTALFPYLHGLDVLEKIRVDEIANTGSDTMFHLQMLNQPKMSRLIASDPSWIKRVPLRQIPESCTRIITVDPAWKGTKNAGEGDFAALTVWAIERRGSLVLRYLLEVVRSNEMTARDGENCIFRLMTKWGVTDVLVEEIGQYVFRSMLEDGATTRGVAINVIDPKMKSTAKSARIVNFLRSVQAGHVLFADPCPGFELFLREYEDFPQLDNDDVIDAAAYICDPEVLEAWTPVFTTHKKTMFELAIGRAMTRPYEQRTRYCAN